MSTCSDSIVHCVSSAHSFLLGSMRFSIPFSFQLGLPSIFSFLYWIQFPNPELSSSNQPAVLSFTSFKHLLPSFSCLFNSSFMPSLTCWFVGEAVIRVSWEAYCRDTRCIQLQEIWKALSLSRSHSVRVFMCSPLHI